MNDTATVGSLLFIQDPIEPIKKRPFICIAVFTNTAGVPYNWWLLPITSKVTIGMSNLVEVKHKRLSAISYAKINDLQSMKWEDHYEVAQVKFAKKYVKDIAKRINSLLTIK